METANQKSVIDVHTQGGRNTNISVEIMIRSREESKRRNEQRTTSKTIRKEFLNYSKYMLFNNYFKFKWTKCSNHKT